MIGETSGIGDQGQISKLLARWSGWDWSRMHATYIQRRDECLDSHRAGGGGGQCPRGSSSRLLSGAEARQGGHVIEMQRRRLLLAIGEMVAEEGLESASVGRVCKRAGVSRRTFYELFEDREACLLAAFDQAIESIAASVLPAYESEAKWGARMRPVSPRCSSGSTRA